MAKLNINSGTSTVGNYSNTDILLNSIDSKITSVKTLKNGIWKSWSKGAPENFQGFLTMAKGTGSVINSTGTTEITISDDLVDANAISITTGLNFLCFPNASKPIGTGVLPRVKVTSVKTMLGSWKSWSKGAPDSFQGFTILERSKGYVCNVESVYDNYITSYKRELNGVRIGTSYINDTSGLLKSSLVVFITDTVFNSIYHEIVSVNNSLPLLDLWISVKNTVKLIKYPTELSNKKFYIKEAIADSIENGFIIDSMTTAEDNGLITDTVISETIDLGDLIGGTLEADIVHEGFFTPNSNNSESNPLVLNSNINLTSLELLYNTKNININPVYNKQHIKLNNVNVVIEFATEYLGEPFVIVKDNNSYNGTFTNSENYITLT